MARDDALQELLSGLAASSSGRLAFRSTTTAQLAKATGLTLRGSRNAVYEFRVSEPGREPFTCIAFTLTLDGSGRPATRVEALGRSLADSDGDLFSLNPLLLVFDYTGYRLLGVSAIELFDAFATRVATKALPYVGSALFSLSPNFEHSTINMYSELASPTVWAQGVRFGDLSVEDLIGFLLQVFHETRDKQAKVGAIVRAIQERVDAAPSLNSLTESDSRTLDHADLQTDPRGFLPEDIDISALGDELKLDESWLSRVIGALHRRGQVILYGPPGTGKTYVAKAITRAIGANAGSSLRIQFHPSYTYEDFFAGYRPREKDGQLIFELTMGPLRRISDAARREPGVTHVLMIDEINRANLSKVFGELYYLLEYRDEPIDLLYAGSGTDGGDTFSLPTNVVIIGTMNTADRSIALLDSAMRRRFSFFELHPDVPPIAGILDRWTDAYPQSFDVSGLFAELNSRIRDREDRIGPSHLLRTDDLSRSALEAIWTENLMPLLEERHLGSAIDVHATFALSVLLEKIMPPVELGNGDGVDSGEHPRE